jgi:hypothetical protein
MIPQEQRLAINSLGVRLSFELGFVGVLGFANVDKLAF